eukprot:418569-Prymnesium_polylepis.2
MMPMQKAPTRATRSSKSGRPRARPTESTGNTVRTTRRAPGAASVGAMSKPSTICDAGNILTGIERKATAAMTSLRALARRPEVLSRMFVSVRAPYAANAATAKPVKSGMPTAAIMRRIWP